MIFLQLLSLLFGLFMLYWSFYIYKKRIIYITELIFWVAIWFVFILIALFPGSTSFILQTLRITRTMDLVMIVAFMILWAITYKNYITNKKLTKKFQEFVRQKAISEVIPNKSNK